MTRYAERSFSVGGWKPPAAECRHGWLDARSRCVLCGVGPLVRPLDPETAPAHGVTTDTTVRYVVGINAESRSDG